MYGFIDSAQLKQVFPCFVSFFKAMHGIKTGLWHFHREIQIRVKKETKVLNDYPTHWCPLIHILSLSPHLSLVFRVYSKKEPQFNSHRLSNLVWEQCKVSTKTQTHTHAQGRTHNQVRQLQHLFSAGGLFHSTSIVWFIRKEQHNVNSPI